MPEAAAKAAAKAAALIRGSLLSAGAEGRAMGSGLSSLEWAQQQIQGTTDAQLAQVRVHREACLVAFLRLWLPVLSLVEQCTDLQANFAHDDRDALIGSGITAVNLATALARAPPETRATLMSLSNTQTFARYVDRRGTLSADDEYEVRFCSGEYHDRISLTCRYPDAIPR